jgi:hypothetical protein
MLGVKISLFNSEDCIESGVFLSTTQADWDFRGPDKVSKIKSSVENVSFSEFVVTQLFQCELIQKVMNAL